MARRSRSLSDAVPAPADATAAVSLREAVAACRDLLAQRHDVVVDAVRFVAARHHLTRDTADELRGRVMLHLTTNDYAALRAWRRECSLHTYLVTVITRVFLDYRNQEWGKAKPPALAKRLGEVALGLWRLTHRKRLTFDEAVQTLHAEHGVTESRDQLWDIYSRLPAASGRYFVDVSELAQAEQPGADADAFVRASERETLAARVERALSEALAGLDAEDRLVLKLFFSNGMTRAQIARVLRLDQQRLYPRFLHIMSRLHDALRAQGVTAEDVREIIGAANLPPGAAVLDEVCKKEGDGPSLGVERAPAPGRRPRLRES
ncbi:MAG: sigma-70 family RNA polymerase sigma factor [Acidobacteria bacterium]|nr:sigma-70 family RNA polymerase sigma factor [Acidobacteriota bacterium]